MFGPDDDEDFTPAGNSKLASLFGQPVEEGNASLTYTAPKQPKKNQSEPPAQTAVPDSSKLSLIIVQAVQIYKLEDGNYINQGRLGAAVLGNIATKVYQLLIYKNRQQHVTATKITDKFQFIVQAKNFASFYDDRGQNWSIMFDSDSIVMNFAREVGLARACAFSEKEEHSFYVQDLKVGEGLPAEMGDLLEIRYTTSPLVNGKLEKAIETNVDAEKPQRVKIRKGVWEEALLGATKGCKKLIILAPILFGPWKPLADPNNRLAVEVEIGRIKACRRSRESTPVDILRHSESPESNVDSSTDETSIKARGASISEALTNSPKTNKASIISRMARMGQPTLPLKGAIVCNPSDSEETEEESSSAATKSSVSPKSVLKTRSLSSKRSTVSHAPSPYSVSQEEIPQNAGNVTPITGSANLPSQQVSVFQQPPSAWHQAQLQQSQTHPAQFMINGVPFAAHSDGQLYATAHQVVSVPAVVSTPSSTPEPLSAYFSENRTHNSEVRMGLSKVVDKVTQVLEKLDSQQTSVGVMEPRTLLASIQKLVVENEQLKVELADKRIKLEQQNEKMYQLLHHKFLEQSISPSAWEQRQDPTLQSVIIGLQQEKSKLAAELSETVAKSNVIQIQATNFERITIELQEEVNKLTAHVQGAYLEIERGKQTIIDQENFIRSLKEKTDASVNLHGTQDSIINELKLNIHELQVSKAQLQTALEETKMQQNLTAKKFSEEISVLQTTHKDEVENLKKSYEDQINSYSKEKINGCEMDCQHLHDVKKLKEKNDNIEKDIASLKNQLKIAQNASIVDLKRVMNVMFKHLKSQFIPEQKYDGSDVSEIILSAIQNITLQFVSMKTGNSPKTSEKENIKQLDEKVQSLSLQSSTENAVSNKIEKVSGNNVVKSEDRPKEENSISEDKNSGESKVKDDMALEKIEIEKNEVEGTEHKEKLSALAEVEKIEVKELEHKEKLNAPADELKKNGNSSPLETKEDPDKSKEKLCDTEENVVSSSQTEKSRDHSMERSWRPQPPPPPLFDDEEDDDDWLS